MRFITRATIGLVAVAAFFIPATAASADPAFCGQVVTTPDTTVTLTGNLYCDGTAITIAADNVTLDLAGHTIKGGTADARTITGLDPRYGGYARGVYVVGASGTRITGGTIRGYDAGVVADHARSTVLEGVAIDNPGTWGVWASDGVGLAVVNSTITGPWTPGDAVDMGDGLYPQAGIDVRDSSDVRVLDSTITAMRGNGVFTQRVGGLTISGTYAVNNAGDGIQSWTTSGVFRVLQSTVSGNEIGLEADHFASGSSITLDTVTVSANREYGVWITDLRRATLTNVDSHDNGLVGIWLSAGIDAETGTTVSFAATIRDSQAYNNGYDGIALDGAGPWILSGNAASSNTGEGFYLGGGRLTSSNNSAHGNGRNGFLFDTGTTGTSSTDSSAKNAGDGFRVNTGPGNTVTLTDATSTSGRAYGMFVNSGVAYASGGSYSYNARDGIRAGANGTAHLSYTTTNKNGNNGVAFAAASAGWAYKITASSNGRYGLCTDPAASYTNYPTHTLTFNSAGATGHACDGYVFPYWWYRP